jgi:hypothetical protein
MNGITDSPVWNPPAMDKMLHSGKDSDHIILAVPGSSTINPFTINDTIEWWVGPSIERRHTKQKVSEISALRCSQRTYLGTTSKWPVNMSGFRLEFEPLHV